MVDCIGTLEGIPVNELPFFGICKLLLRPMVSFGDGLRIWYSSECQCPLQ